MRCNEPVFFIRSLTSLFELSSLLLLCPPILGIFHTVCTNIEDLGKDPLSIKPSILFSFRTQLMDSSTSLLVFEHMQVACRSISGGSSHKLSEACNISTFINKVQKL
eukprot:TRINITY_DN19778_c0_g1_i1.p1 TRINITY_DN19778_c0_g1~~TRINITY_DN19778_c0_g1_i1.p1  ORF type:complete len:107 (-),score=2.14 TRINITY_DN19778_c0_g1_i1:1-321(-)